MTAPSALTATTVPLHLTVDPWWDMVEVLAYGTHCDLIGADRYTALVDQQVALVLDEDGEDVIGVVAQGWSELEDLDQEGVAEWWDGPRFDVPVLGLLQASVGEILVAVRGRFGEGEPTADALHAHTAMQAPNAEEALPHWQLALEAGDLKAHYAIGYTLCELGLFRRAYDHLRFWTELAPVSAWAWCWFGQACEGADLPGEAREAYERAVTLDRDAEVGEETTAAELLAAMG